MALLVRLLLLSVVAMVPLSLRAAELSWDGDCGTNGWYDLCDLGSTSNWDNDDFPGPTDSASIPPEAGEVVIDLDVEVSSISAESGLEHDFFDLTVGSGLIQGLRLFGQGDLFVSGSLMLTGPTFVQADLFGPGTVTSTGSVELGFADLRGGVTFRNRNAARITSNRLDVFSGTSFENEGSLDIGSDRDVGGLGVFRNSGRLSYLGPGTGSVFDPEYVQAAGELEIQAGLMQLRSTRIELSGGSVSIAEGATLKIASDLGGQQLKSFSGLAAVTGLGLLDVLEDMTVSAPLELGLGEVALRPTGGRGGFRLNGATLTLQADLTNRSRSRMRFQNGTLVGVGGSFTNNGDAYTRITGSATFRADVTNNGRFFLLGPGISLGGGATFTNNGIFTIEAGSISQGPGVAGVFKNFGDFQMDANAPTVVTHVRVPFDNRDIVFVIKGILRFEAPVANLSAGTLSGGFWQVGPGGTLDFPEAITELFNCAIAQFGGQIPDLSSLRAVTGGSELDVAAGGSLTLDGPLTVAESSEVSVSSSSTLSIQGETVVKEGSHLTIEGPSVLGSVGPMNLGDPIDPPPPEESVIPELAGITVLTLRASGAGATVPSGPTVITPLLNNAFGRVLPTERGSIGTLQLNGDYAQGTGGFLAIEVVDGGSDLLSIDGNASLAGTLELTRLGDVPAGSTFTILTTTNGTVTGTFDQVLSPDLFSVEYLPAEVRVTLDESVVQCGDVNGSGFVDAADPILLRRRLAGIGVLQNPERCNVIGAADPADSDGDGLRDDCNVADSVVLRRSLTGLGPSIRNDCGQTL